VVREAAAWAVVREEAAWAVVREEGALATGRVVADQIVLEAGISRAAVAETAMPSEEAPGDTTDRALGPAAAAVPPAWGPAAAALVAAVAEVAAAVAGGAGKRPRSQKKIRGA
jgi:hypothetical protein